MVGQSQQRKVTDQGETEQNAGHRTRHRTRWKAMQNRERHLEDNVRQGTAGRVHSWSGANVMTGEDTERRTQRPRQDNVQTGTVIDRLHRTRRDEA